MKNITRLSLALIMFSLFSISYLVTSVSAQMGAPDMSPPSNFDDNLMGAQGQGMGSKGRPQRNDRMEMFIEDERGIGQRRGGQGQGMGSKGRPQRNDRMEMFIEDERGIGQRRGGRAR
jgi:hypothetical protein